MARNISTVGFITDHGKGHHIERENLPKVNGIPIDGVWSPDTFCKDERVLDDTNWSLSTPNPFTKTDAIDGIGTIPQEFKDLLGWQVIQGKKRFINNVSFRTDSSGHASHDDFMTVYGYDYNKSAWFRDEDYEDNGYSLTQNDPYVKKWLALCRKELTIKYAPNPDQSFELTFPVPKLKAYNGTCIKNTGGLNYPTMFSENWIPFGHLPYISLDNLKNVRVLDERLEAHVYFQEVEEEDIVNDAEDLIRISFDNRENSMYYCFISTWKKSGDYVRFRVVTSHRDNSITVRSVEDDGTLGRKERRNKSGFYRMMSMRKF